MEQKLERYRSQKRREELFENIKARIRKMLPFQQAAEKKKETDHVINIIENQQNDEEELLPSKPQNLKKSKLVKTLSSSDTQSESDHEEIQTIADTSKKKTWLDYVTYTVYLLFWSTLYAIAVQLKFGVVYFMLSCLAGIYLNTRTGPKKKDEISAYSVFNPNMESIDGTLKAEQFEREMGLRVK